MNPTVVVFRVDPDGGVFALLPFDVEPDGSCTVYDPTCGHGLADYTGCVARSRPALPDEFLPVLGRMRRMGYNGLAVRRRRPRSDPGASR